MLVLILVWVAVAAITVYVMAHRGHSWFAWAVIGGTLGPLSWPLAARTLIADRRQADPPQSAADLLIAVAPWEVSPEWVVASLGEVDPPVRSATVVSVLDAEDADTPAGQELAAQTEALLIRCRDAVAEMLDGPVDHRLLFGRPPDAIARSADSGGFRAILLGPSGSRLHHLVHGHTRSRLERLTSIPVFSGRAAA